MNEPLSPDTQKQDALRLIEAILFASGEPVPVATLQAQVGVELQDVLDALQTLQAHYAPRGVTLAESDGTWRFQTALDLADRMKITRQPRRKLPRAAAEVLAIIAYHQPVTRAEIESIRGVETSKGTLDILLELSWVRPGKRRETPGRPLTWHTTPDFLSHFNLTSVKDLPCVEDLKAAGLLDARPILATMPKEGEGKDSDTSTDDEDFAAWIKDEPELVEG